LARFLLGKASAILRVKMKPEVEINPEYKKIFEEIIDKIKIW
jgi:hypothetical protein